MVKVGEVPKTNAPEPVSSDIAVFNSSDVAVKVLLVKLIVLLVKVSVPAKLTKSPSVSEVLYSAIVPFFKLALVIFRDKGVPAGSSTMYKTSSSLAEVSSVRF